MNPGSAGAVGGGFELKTCHRHCFTAHAAVSWVFRRGNEGYLWEISYISGGRFSQGGGQLVGKVLPINNG